MNHPNPPADTQAPPAQVAQPQQPAAPKSPYEAPQVEVLLRQAIDLVEAARPMPLSASSIINKEEVLGLLAGAVEALPDELRAARWLLKEREEFLARVKREGDEILDVARARAERMVQRTEVAKSANSRARQIVDAAEAEARRMRHEVEDYCDQKLGSFEIVLQKTLDVVGNGRQRLQGSPLQDLARIAGAEEPPQPVEEDAEFFDQDTDV